MLTKAFVPLTTGPAKPAGNDFQVLSAADPSQAQAFRPFKPGAARGTEMVAITKPVCEPRVTLGRDGNCITSIHIQCSCGQVIDLACSYETAADPA